MGDSGRRPPEASGSRQTAVPAIFRRRPVGKSAAPGVSLGPPGQLFADILAIDETGGIPTPDGFADEADEGADFDVFARKVLRALVTRLLVERVAIYWYSDLDLDLSLLAEFPPQAEDSSRERETESGIVLEVFESGRALALPRAKTPALAAGMAGPQRVSVAYFPFNDDSGCSGVLSFVNRQTADGLGAKRQGFSDRDLNALQALLPSITQRLQIAWTRTRTINLSRWVVDTLRTARLDTSAIANSLVGQVRYATNCREATIYRWSEEDPDWLQLVAQEGVRSVGLGSIRRLPIRKSLNGRAFSRGRPEIVPNIKLRKEEVANWDLAEAEKVVSALIVPFEAGSVRGVMSALSTRQRTFMPTTIQHLRYLGGAYAAMVEVSEQTLRADQIRHELDEICHNLRRPFRGMDHYRASIARRTSRLISTLNLGGQASMASVLAELGIMQEDCEKARLETELGQKRTTDILLKSRRLRREDLDLEPVRVPAMIERICEAFSKEARKRPVSLDIKAGVNRLPVILADRDRLEIAIENLVDNAIKYSWRDEAVVITGESTASDIRITIADKGLGIPPWLLQAVFGRATTSGVRDRTRRIMSSGLGLFVTREVVEAHGGSVKAESVPFLADKLRTGEFEGFETTFVLRLPIKPKSALPQASSRSNA